MAAWALAEFGPTLAPVCLTHPLPGRCRLQSADVGSTAALGWWAEQPAPPVAWIHSEPIPRLRFQVRETGAGRCDRGQLGNGCPVCDGARRRTILAEIYRTGDGQRRLAAARALMKLGPDGGEAIPTLMADLRAPMPGGQSCQHKSWDTRREGQSGPAGLRNCSSTRTFECGSEQRGRLEADGRTNNCYRFCWPRSRTSPSARMQPEGTPPKPLATWGERLRRRAVVADDAQ